MDFSGFALSTSDYQAWGGVFVLVVVGMATRSESRTLWAAIAASVVAPTPATFYVVALLSLVWKILSAVHIGLGR